MSTSLAADLQDAANLPDGQGRADLVETHCSQVFLTQGDVYKVKRAKNYGFLDYSTLAKREFYCREEVRLNRRLAERVYLGVLPVWRDAEGYSLTRRGELVDWAVHMRRLPDDCSAEALLTSGRLRAAHLDGVAELLARLYANSEIGRGDVTTMARNLRENFEQAQAFVGEVLSEDRLAECRRRQEAWLRAQQDRLATRSIVDGHGDLRLEHVYLLPGESLIIDCIEFADRYRVGDWALDAAFLAMDLRQRERSELAEYFLGRLAYELDDYEFYPLLDGYMSYRAVVRGKVACFVAVDPGTSAAVVTRKRREARALFDLASACLEPSRRRPRIIAIGGGIATGKSTLAWALSRRLGLPVVVADATRKSLAGLAHDARGGADLYTDVFTQRMHAELLRRADLVLASGRSVLVDTTFRRHDLRQRFLDLAVQHGAEFRFVECRVPSEVARARLRARRGGVSDAREGQLAQLALWDRVRGLGQDQHIVVDGTEPVAAIVAQLAPRLLQP